MPRCSPEGIRTLATAVRGRRPRPLDDGALETLRTPHLRAESGGKCYTTGTHGRAMIGFDISLGTGRVVLVAGVLVAGVLGLEPRMRESESLVLPITPYPKGTPTDPARVGAEGPCYLSRSSTRKSGEAFTLPAS